MVKHISKNKQNYIWMTLTFVFAALFAISMFTNWLEFSGEEKITGFVVKVLTDERCDECGAYVSQIETQLKTIFPDMEIEYYDYSSKDGKKLYEETGVVVLPAFLFSEEAETVSGYEQLASYMELKGSYNSLRIGAEFNPTAEICTNNKDDTGNGLIDCEDPSCASKLECREELEKHLAVFIMSDCPYGREAIKALEPVLLASPELTYEINYIATETSPGEFQSLHGAYEVEEDIRQLCVKELAQENFFPYVLCRSKGGVNGVDWKTCATELGLDQAEIESCANGDLGKTLLSENIKIAEELGIGGSPTWIANNRYQFGGITSAVVQSNVCKYNVDLEGCDETLSSESAVPAGQC